MSCDKLKEQGWPAGSLEGKALHKGSQEEAAGSCHTRVQHLLFLSCGLGSPSASDPRKHCSLHYKISPRLYPNCRQAQVRSESSNDVPVLVSERDSVLGGGTLERRGVMGAK